MDASGPEDDRRTGDAELDSSGAARRGASTLSARSAWRFNRQCARSAWRFNASTAISTTSSTVCDPMSSLMSDCS